MTPGQEALAEAARLESARIYGRTSPEHRDSRTVHERIGHGDPEPTDVIEERRRIAAAMDDPEPEVSSVVPLRRAAG